MRPQGRVHEVTMGTGLASQRTKAHHAERALRNEVVGALWVCTSLLPVVLGEGALVR